MSETILKRKFFEDGGEQCMVAFAQDGMDVKDTENTKLIKIDISQAVRKYHLPIP